MLLASGRWLVALVVILAVLQLPLGCLVGRALRDLENDEPPDELDDDDDDDQESDDFDRDELGDDPEED